MRMSIHYHFCVKLAVLPGKRDTLSPVSKTLAIVSKRTSTYAGVDFSDHGYRESDR